MENVAKDRPNRTRRLAWAIGLVVLMLVLLYVLVGRRGSSIDKPYPVSNARYAPGFLESLMASLNLREYPPLYMSTQEETALLACINLSKLTNHSVNGVAKFEDPQVKGQLLSWRKKMASPFYAEFLLAKWHERQDETTEAEHWMTQALEHAPIVLIRKYESLDGKPLANTPVGRLGVECRMKTPTSTNVGPTLEYIDLTTDAQGRVFLPCYDTRIRCSSVQWPEGYEIETGRHGYLKIHARYSLLPTIYAWRRDQPRPATDLPPSEFYDYRNAQQVQGLTHRVGEAEFRINRCFRQDNDGTILATDGRVALGQADVGAVPAFPEPHACLDQAVVRFQRSTLSGHHILQTRLFDHRTRALLTKYHAPTAFSYDGDGEIALKSFAWPLPELLDVWFWVTTFDSQEKVQNVPAQVGATAEFAHYKAELTHLHNGTRPSSSSGNTVTFGPPYKGGEDGLQAAFKITAKMKGSDNEYGRVIAVYKNGARVMNDRAVYPHNSAMVCRFPMTLADLDHFELCPVGREQWFFFEGVRLPAIADRDLAESWEVTIPTGGQTGTFAAPPTQPAHVTVSVLAGRNSMSYSNRSVPGLGSYTHWRYGDQDRDLETYATVVRDMKGLTNRMLRTEIIPLGANNQPLAESRGSGQSGSITHANFPVPAEKIHAVRIRLSLDAN